MVITRYSKNSGSKSIIPQSLDLSRSTQLCRLMNSCGSDKSLGYHNYTILYSALFKSLRKKKLRVFEMGLGSNNPTIPSSMGPYGTPGASLHGWKQYFQSANISGADIDQHTLFDEDRINTFYCDQTDPLSIKKLWSKDVFKNGIDIFIDDGLHTFDANTCLFENSIHVLNNGGIYFIEDVLTESIWKWTTKIRAVYIRQYPEYIFTLVNLPNKINRFDNNLIIIEKHQ